MVWPTLGSRTAKEQNRTEEGAVAHHQQYSVRLAVTSSKFIHQVRWSWHQKSIFARITCLFGLSGNYYSVAERDSRWLSAAARRVGRVFERSFGSVVYGPAPSGQSATKQSSWDRPGLLADSVAVEAYRTSPFQRACLLAVAAHAPHSGDSLLALLITACGLRLEDEAVRFAVVLPRLGSELVNVQAHVASNLRAWRWRIGVDIPRRRRCCRPTCTVGH